MHGNPAGLFLGEAVFGVGVENEFRGFTGRARVNRHEQSAGGLFVGKLRGQVPIESWDGRTVRVGPGSSHHHHGSFVEFDPDRPNEVPEVVIVDAKLQMAPKEMTDSAVVGEKANVRGEFGFEALSGARCGPSIGCFRAQYVGHVPVDLVADVALKV